MDTEGERFLIPFFWTLRRAPSHCRLTMVRSENRGWSSSSPGRQAHSSPGCEPASDADAVGTRGRVSRGSHNAVRASPEALRDCQLLSVVPRRPITGLRQRGQAALEVFPRLPSAPETKKPTSVAGFTVLKLCSTRNDKAPQQS
jgi:hypothetical protein